MKHQINFWGAYLAFLITGPEDGVLYKILKVLLVLIAAVSGYFWLIDDHHSKSQSP